MKLLSSISGRERAANHEQLISSRSVTKATAIGLSLGDAGRMQNLETLYCHAHSTMYKWPTTSRQCISVQEIMLDTRLSSHIPCQYLMLLIKQESASVGTLTTIENLVKHLEFSRSDYKKNRGGLLEQYNDALRNIISRGRDVFFKASTLKTKKELEFIPTNLHLQRMRVQHSDFIADESLHSTSGVANPSEIHDVVTVGVASAHCLKFKNGGLSSLISMAPDKLKNSVISTNQLPQEVRELSANLQVLEKEVASVISMLRKMFSDGKITGSVPTRGSVKPSMSELIKKTNALLDLFDNKDLSESMPLLHNGSSASSARDKWDEMKDVTKMKLTGIVNKISVMLDAADDLLGLRQDIASPSFDEVLSDLSELSKRLNDSASLAMQAHAVCVIQSLQEPAEVTYRRDVVFSQVLSTCVCGVITKLISSIDDHSGLENYVKHGMLLQWHSLLSTYKNELGMLEDLFVGVYDLRKVVFCCVQAPERDGSGLDVLLPSLQGTRDKVIVKVPLDAICFGKLPDSLKSSMTFKIIPILFNVGINEEQTLADRMGKSSLQESINIESCSHLSAYCQDMKHSGDAAIGDRLEKLKEAVHSKRTKNVQILHLAGEICRLVRGVRVSSCKSGKDRTSMAVTLEQVQVLLEQHGLRPNVFESALDCMRRTGTRLENTRKNVGKPKYAFTRMQLMTFPRLYIPPEGTYNNLPS